MDTLQENTFKKKLGKFSQKIKKNQVMNTVI